MTNIEISELILTQLKAQLSSDIVNTHTIQLFPDDPEQFIDTNPTGAILVFLGEKRLTEPDNEVVQIEINTLKIHILNTSLNIQNSLYQLANSVRNIVEKISILGSRLYLSAQSEPVYHNNFFWHTEMTFILPLQYIKD